MAGIMAVAGREIGKPGKNAEKEFEIGASFLDISTGEFLTTQFRDSENFEKLLSELARMSIINRYISILKDHP